MIITAKGTTTITYICQGDCLATTLIPTKTLAQYIDSAQNNAITPDFSQAENQPAIYPLVLSSLTGNIIIPDDSGAWYINQVEIPFSGNSSTAFGIYAAGTFVKTTFDLVVGSTTYTIPSLSIQKNIISTTNTTNSIIQYEGHAISDTFGYKIKSAIDLRLIKTQGTAFIAQITATNGGIVNDVITSTRLTASLAVGSAQNLTYEWYRGNNVLVDMSNELTVNRDEIDTNEIFRCKIYSNGTFIASGAITVYDQSDTQFIMPNPSPADEVVSATQPRVTYIPKVYLKSTNAEDPNRSYAFSYEVYDSMGTKQTFEDGRSTTGASFYVTVDDAKKANNGAGGNLTLAITATEND